MARPKKDAEESQQQTPGLIRVIPVYGPMHHLILNKPIVGETLFEGMDGWLQAQIDAGKLTLVE